MRHAWTNWLGNHQAHCAAIVAPTSTEQLVEILDDPRRRGLPVRVLGGGHSWSPLVPTDGVLLSTAGLTRIRGVDRDRARITVETGATIGQLVEVATRNGLSVRSPSMYLGLTVGGLVATGSHGTGREVATFGDEVVGFELVAADGTVHQVDAPGSELWRAVITNLGVLGVVTAVTLQCEPLYNVHESHARVDVADVAALLPAVLAEYEFVSLFWHPMSRQATFKLGNRSALPAETVVGRIEPTLRDRANGWLGRLLPHVATRVPGLAAIVGDAIDAGLGSGGRVVSEPYFSHYQQSYPKVISSEFAIPIDAAPPAWSWLSQRLGQYAAAGVRPVDLVVHARFGRASAALIASSSGRASCHLEVLSFAGNRQRELFAGEFQATMQDRFAGRPHWGKDIFDPWQATRGYGEDLERFLAVRHELDPDQRLLNPFLRDEVFGLGRRLRPVIVATEQPANDDGGRGAANDAGATLRRVA